jgi:branched-chain amino acid transport system substrate-binding protein
LLASVGLVLAVASASCSRGGDDDEATPPNEGPQGESLVVGFVNTEGSPLGSIEELRVGSEAALAYVNAELDGVHGRPLRFETCITNSSPESSTACANQMVERRVVAVLGGVDLGSAAALPVLKAAGIPYVATTPLLPADFTTDGAFTLDPGGLGVAASAVFAVDELKVQRVAVLHDDSPQGRQLAEVFVRPALLQRGLLADRIQLFPEKADAPDLAPAVAAATQSKPDAVIVVFPPQACPRIMQAFSSLGVKAHAFYIGRCAAPAVVAAGGPGAEGAYFFSSILHPDAHADDPEVALYVQKVKEFGEKGVDPRNYDVARGFATTMTFHRRLLTLEADAISAASITAAFRGAVDVPSYMGHAFTCDGRQGVPGFVSLCNSHVRVYQLVEGRFRDASADWISAGAALAG